jgi:hypothetical protein
MGTRLQFNWNFDQVFEQLAMGQFDKYKEHLGGAWPQKKEREPFLGKVQFVIARQHHIEQRRAAYYQFYGF